MTDTLDLTDDFVAEYEKQHQELEKARQELRDRLPPPPPGDTTKRDSLQAELAAAEEKLAAAERQLQDAKSQWSEEKSQREAAERSRDELQTRVAQLTRECDELTCKCDELGTCLIEKKRLEIKLKKLETKLNEPPVNPGPSGPCEKCAAADNELATLRARVNDLKRESTAWKSQRDELALQLTKCVEERRGLEKIVYGSGRSGH